ncbi:MAG: RecX family transcriptional regulator [Bacteroidetes bacterium]|nr:RecX family transcriptional regulator [Bacteroidota bacterium]
MSVEQQNKQYLAALGKAEKFCSKQETCISGIRKKLDQWGINPAYHEKIIKDLKEEKFIDETRYASLFVKEKFRFNQWGIIKIRHAMKLKQIPEYIINEAINEIPDDEYFRTLEKIMKQKLRIIKTGNKFEQKGKLYRHAASKGYENDKIMQVINSILGQ